MFMSAGNLREFTGERGLERFVADVSELYPWDKPTLAAAYLLGESDQRGCVLGPGKLSIVSIVTDVAPSTMARVVNHLDATSVWNATSAHRAVMDAAREVARAGVRLAVAMIGPWPIADGKQEVMMTAEHLELGPVVRMWAAPPGARKPAFRCDLIGFEAPEFVRVLYPQPTVN